MRCTCCGSTSQRTSFNVDSATDRIDQQRDLELHGSLSQKCWSTVALPDTSVPQIWVIRVRHVHVCMCMCVCVYTTESLTAVGGFAPRRNPEIQSQAQVLRFSTLNPVLVFRAKLASAGG